MPREYSRRVTSTAARAIEERLRLNPEERSIWLVYADHLLDQGDIRGELIQLWGRAHDPERPEEERSAASSKIRAIEDNHRKRWLEGWPFEGRAQLSWRYGFVVAISFGSKDCLPALLDALVRHKTARLLSHMSLSQRYAGDDNVSAIAGAEIFRQISILNLERNYLHARSVRALGDAGALCGLRSLKICDNPLGYDGVEALAAVHMEHLARLDLADCAVNAGALRLLAAADGMPALASLNLRRNPLGDPEAIEALRARGIEIGLSRS